MSTESKITQLTKQLYPKGRAFKISTDSVSEKLHLAIAHTEQQAYDDALAVLNVILPDNMNFTADDATRWEERLGLITVSGVSLANRKLAIIRKINHPGTIPARQNYLYLQEQLQAAGFDVYVYENIFAGPVTMTPTDILGGSIVGIGVYGTSEYGAVVYGDAQTGSIYENCVANYIDEILDQWFDVGDNLRNTFFISSAYIDVFADVPEIRKEEFRQLILKIKPVQTVGFLFVNYV